MTTAAKNAELADVLSSLRKLVEDEPGALDENHSVHEVLDDIDETLQDKLVLGPSLRVEADHSESLEQKITKLERLIANTEEQWEPDGDEASEYAGYYTDDLAPEQVADTSEPIETIEEPDDTSVAIPDVSIGEPEGSNAPEAEDADTLPKTAIDEAALEEMVAALIRKELRGALGEKITKNIRKMVRREIHDAIHSAGLTD